MVKWIKTFYSSVLAVLIIILLLAAGPDRSRHRLEFSAGYEHENYEGYYERACDYPRYYKINNNGYIVSANYIYQPGEEFYFNLLSFINIKTYTVTLEKTSEYPYTHRSMSRLYGLERLNLNFNLGKFIGLSVGINAFNQYRKEELKIFLFPNLTLRWGPEIFHLYLSILDIENNARPSYLGVGFGSDSERSSILVGLKLLSVFTPYYYDCLNLGCDVLPPFLSSKSDVYIKLLHKFDDKVSGGMVIDFWGSGLFQLTLIGGFDF